MDKSKFVLVMLRQPRLDDPNEMRTDPLWEFGSFGCTGCHRRNLMNPKKLSELNGTRFCFAQAGPHGVKLVHVTSPVRMLHHGMFAEAKWSAAEMPLKYAMAPTLVNNRGMSDIPELLEMLRGVRRGTPVAQFASKFRARRQPLPATVGQRMLEVYEQFRRQGGCISRSYVDALPCVPPRVDRDRASTYRRLLQNGAATNTVERNG